MKPGDYVEILTASPFVSSMYVGKRGRILSKARGFRLSDDEDSALEPAWIVDVAPRLGTVRVIESSLRVLHQCP